MSQISSIALPEHIEWSAIKDTASHHVEELEDILAENPNIKAQYKERYLMQNIQLNAFKVIFIVGSLVALMLSGKAFAYDVNVSMSNSAITISTADSRVKTIALSVLNPNGELVFSDVLAGKRIVWSLGPNSVDGQYKYEATLSNVVVGSRERGKALNVAPIVSKHSGSAFVMSGQLIVPSANEEEDQGSLLSDGVEFIANTLLNVIAPAAHADQVIVDDLIVESSVCVGVDCVNGESFGTDSIRFKENNIRMHFNDTSVSASFPRNDWRFIFNDSTNGGANMFSIEDSSAGRRIFTLDAGAPTNSLYVDTSGRVGLGTSTPTATLDMTTGNSPAIRFNQNSSLGFTSQAWDLYGNEEGFFLRDFTGGANIPLSIAVGAPSNALVVNASGNIGVGQSNPTEALHVMGNAIISGNLELGSSRLIKSQIKDLGIEQAMSAFRSLEPVMFNYNHSPNKQSIGFIAEDVPDLVATESRKSLQPMDIVALLTKVVQEQQKAIDELSETVDALRAEKGNK